MKDPFIIMESADGIFSRHTPQQAMDKLWKYNIRPSPCVKCADVEPILNHVECRFILNERQAVENLTAALRERNAFFDKANQEEQAKKIAIHCNKDLSKRFADMTIERDYWKLKAGSR